MKLSLLALAITSSLLCAEDKVAAVLPAFGKQLEEAFQSSTGKEQTQAVERAVGSFEQAIAPMSLDELAKYARDHAKDESGAAWNLLPVFVVRGRLDVVADVALDSLATMEEGRQYRMWKWWEHLFGERSDFDTLSLKLGRAFLHRYEQGDAKTRSLIADIFGRKDLRVEEFRKLIEGGKSQTGK